LIKKSDEEFQKLRDSKRSSRESNAHNLRVLSQLSHNKARPGNKKRLKINNVL